MQKNILKLSLSWNIKPFSVDTDFRRQILIKRQIMMSKVDPHTERIKYL